MRSSTASRPLPGPVTGQSGRIYTSTKLIHDKFHKSWNFNTRIYKARSQNQLFVLKQLIPRYYRQALDIAAEFPDGSQHLRHPADQVEESNMLVCPYYKTALLDLIEEFPDFPVVERLRILRCVAEGIKELHDKEWLHFDIKPDNILLDWEFTPSGSMTGNSQCLYTLGASDYLILSSEERERLIKGNIPDELEVLVRHICFFEHTQEELEGLVKHMAGDGIWEERLRNAFEEAKLVVEKHPDQKFSCWGMEMGEAMVRLVLGMTRMDPRKRLTIGEVLGSEVFDLDEESSE